MSFSSPDQTVPDFSLLSLQHSDPSSCSMRGAVHLFPFFPQLFFSLSIPASPVLPAFSLLLCLWARSLSRLCLKPSASFAFPSGFLVSLWSCRELSEAREGGPLQEQGRGWRVSGRAEQEGRFLNQGPSFAGVFGLSQVCALSYMAEVPFSQKCDFPIASTSLLASS